MEEVQDRLKSLRDQVKQLLGVFNSHDESGGGLVALPDFLLTIQSIYPEDTFDSIKHILHKY